MPRVGRKHLNTCYFHIIVQGINKEYIFDNELYMKKYQYLMFLNIEKYKLNLIAYCIMSNHTHMLLQTEDINNLSKFMQCTNTSFSKFYNEKKNRVGIVFRSRYKSEPIFDNKYLCNCIAYIHNNPVKAGIVSAPEKYKYSSYKRYINGKMGAESMQLFCRDNMNFLESFIKIHNNDECLDFDDYKEDIDYNEEIKKLLPKSVGEIILDEELLEKTVKRLIINQKVPIKKVCEIFKLTRYKISILLKNK